LKAAIVDLPEHRKSRTARIERTDGRIFDCAALPLPDGATLMTSLDVTAGVNIERALTERNQALIAAEKLRNDFVNHVSYELRTPLTNIIGFTQLLADPRIGPLTERQREYVGYVMSSSTALLAIVNDILDLATIDAGVMELDLAEVDIAETVDGAIEGLQDRIKEARIRLEKRIPRDIGAFVADGKRIRQILFNLIANAISFSKEGGKITVRARRGADFVDFTVDDEGAGIPRDFLPTAFDRFASRARGEVRGGAGLGLSIVKSFVGLHGGSVAIESEEGHGARVTCRLPVRPGITAAAAE
jgi:signal transduction histidine kinase